VHEQYHGGVVGAVDLDSQFLAVDVHAKSPSTPADDRRRLVG
jgi:hypothetical protein